MNKTKPGSIIEIPLPDGRFAYGCLFDSVIIGIYKIISSDKLEISDVILNKIEIYVGCNQSYIKKGLFPIIGKINLTNDDIYPPDLAWYAEWLPDDSVERSAIRNSHGKTEYTDKEYYISLVKKGQILYVFTKPDYLSFWLIDNLYNWPNYKMPK